jgi:hypothetical protein
MMPWKTILVNAPAIVDAARTFYTTTRTPAADALAGPRASDGLHQLRGAVEAMEAREARQAQLFAELAKQVESMATALEVLRARVTFALAGASVALAVALVALVLLLRR